MGVLGPLEQRVDQLRPLVRRGIRQKRLRFFDRRQERRSRRGARGG